MSLAAQYQRFLASPTADALADKASINYITTLTTFNEPLPILKHLVSQGKQLQKKSEKVISTIDSGNALCLDVETTIQFVSGGGAYLPGLDDNFLADRVAIFPIVHVVHFDENGKITQIRQYWDQASLLKQVEVIGARANNWPIRDGKDMVRLIANTASAVPSTGSSRPSTSGSQDPNAVTISQRPSSRQSTRSNSTSATGDPHATLNLFQPIEEEESVPSTGGAAARGGAPRGSKKPAPRDMGELFVNEGIVEDKDSIPVKAGASKKWGANRLFDEEEVVASPTKGGGKQYDHFEFGNGEDTPKADRAVNLKHQSQWGFEDFVTPQKYAPKPRGQEVRTFGWSDDEPEESPVRKPVIHQPRRDAKSQFEFQDDGTPEGHRLLPKNNKGKIQNVGMGLYKDNVIGEESDEAQSAPQKKPLGNVTAQYNNESRKKTFGAQWEVTDDSPANTKSNAPSEQPIKSAPENIKKVAKSTDSHWSLYDESPKSKENVPRKIYKTAGNGMGGRSDAKMQWGFGDEADEAYDAVETENRGRTTAQQKTNKPVEKSFWDF